MDTGLSDLLTCPRCGPEYGLVVLPHAQKERRVVRGLLGCANCRERYPVEGEVADLRVGRVEEGVAVAGGPGDREAAVRLAALMGLAEAHGTVLVAGPGAVHASQLSEVVPEVEVVAVDGIAGVGVSPMRVSGVLPFRSGSLRGVALTGGRTSLLEEGARVLGREGRLVLEPVPEGGRERLEAAGLMVLAEEEGTVVAGRRG